MSPNLATIYWAIHTHRIFIASGTVQVCNGIGKEEYSDTVSSDEVQVPSESSLSCFLPPASEGWGEGTVFSLFVSPHLDPGGGGSWPTGGIPIFPDGGTPILPNGGKGTPIWWTGGTPIWLMGIPWGWMGYPIGTRWGYPLVDTGWRYSPHRDWMGVPPPTPIGRSEDRVATRLAVCLFRSRRRTFLSFLIFVF